MNKKGKERNKKREKNSSSEALKQKILHKKDEQTKVIFWMRARSATRRVGLSSYIRKEKEDFHLHPGREKGFPVTYGEIFEFAPNRQHVRAKLPILWYIPNSSGHAGIDGVQPWQSCPRSVFLAIWYLSPNFRSDWNLVSLLSCLIHYAITTPPFPSDWNLRYCTTWLYLALDQSIN